MKPKQESLSSIEQWMRDHFPDTHVDSHHIESGSVEDVVLFRAHADHASDPAYELLISYEAFEDYPPEDIARDLDRLKVAEVLRKRPEQRLMYDRHRRVGQA